MMYCFINFSDTCFYCVLFLSQCRDHAQMSIDIITRLLPEDHLLLASSKRVKGMIV